MDLNLIIPFLISLLLTCLFIPVTILIAKKLGLVDDPTTRPHPAHIKKIILPRAGGLAIYLGIFITALVFLPLSKYLVGIIAGATILLILGLIDDKVKDFNPYLRLGLLFLSAGAAVGSGIGISFIANPFLPGTFIRLDEFVVPIYFFGKHNIIVIADIFAFLWIVTLTQVINWSKGVDGQMPSITLIASLVLGFLSLKLFLNGDNNQYDLARLSFIVAGSSLGFLFFNWYPSKILPGFSASTILAFLLAVLSILSGAKLATATLALAIPIIDFFYTFFRRIFSGHSPVWGDRGHLHHKLLDLGWSPRKISLFYMIGSAILGGVALLIDTKGKLFALVGVSIILIVFLLWVNSFGALSKRSDRDNG